MSEFGRELASLMEARGIGVRELARAVPCNPGHISNLRSGRDRASAEMAARLDDVLDAGGTLLALVPGAVAAAGDDEIAALRLELAVNDLAVAYPGTSPGELLGRVRAYLGYVTGLLDARATLRQRRSLMTTGGWLSLLAATCLIDLHADAPAAAHLRTAAQLARETGNAEIAAWALETQAWQALNAGDYRHAADLAQAAQHVAPHGGSAVIQSVARLGPR